MAESFLIRPMKKGDLDEIMEIENACFTMPWSRESMRSESGNRGALYLVGEANGKIAGYGGGWLVIDEAHITTIAVHPDFQGRGYGRAVLDALLDGFAARGIGFVLLEVRVSNEKAIALYKSVGFRHLSLRKRYYEDNGEDAHVMLLEMERRTRPL